MPSLPKKYPYETKTKYIFFSQILLVFRFESDYINIIVGFHLSRKFSFSLKFGDRYIFFFSSEKHIAPTPILKGKWCSLELHLLPILYLPCILSKLLQVEL